MPVYCFGISHQKSAIAALEKISFSRDAAASAVERAPSFPDLGEIVVLSTCNRVEIYGFSEKSSMPEQSLLELIHECTGNDPKDHAREFYRYTGSGAARHLFEVAAGLDSMVVGENEILGQLKEAFRAAHAAGSVHSVLYRLMEKALKVGKDVRTKTRINQGAVSIPSVAVELAEKIFGKLTAKKVMVLGTGEMATLTLKNLATAGADISFVVSRSKERGEYLASQFGAWWVPFDEFPDRFDAVDIVISSTEAPRPVVTVAGVQKAMQERKSKPLFIIDIGMPRNVEADVNTLGDVYLYNLENLKGVSDANLEMRKNEVEAALDFIERAVSEFDGWAEQLKARPTVERFESFLDKVLAEEFARLQKETGLTDEQIEVVRNRLRNKILHPPLQRIKESSRSGGVTRYLEALRSLFNLEQDDR